MPSKPNILLIMTDQQRCDSLGCYGSDFVQTPNVDSLARDGIRFDNCYVANTICTPSRASIMTGKHLPGHGVYRLHDILPSSEKLFTCHLQDAGYKTALFGKLHVSGRSFERENRNLNDGFDIYEYAMNPHDVGGTYNSYAQWLRREHPEFFKTLEQEGRNVKNIPEDAHFTTWSAERTMDFIRKQNSVGQPFFAFMSVVDPHDPYGDYPIASLNYIREDKIPEPHGISEEDVHKLPDPIIREHEHSYLGNFHKYDMQDIKEMRKGYYASVAFLDKQIGRVLNCLKELDIYDDTIIIFLSDHGDMLGDHSLLIKGGYFFDECTRVPLIIKPPASVPYPSVVSGLVQAYDIAATILHSAGISPDVIQKAMPDSRNLLDRTFLKTCRDEVYCLYRNTGIGDERTYFSPPNHASMIRTRKYKLSLYHNAETEPKGELYDMEKDPLEENNLWNDQMFAHIKADLLIKLCNWLTAQEISGLGSRGGEMFPDKSQWLNLNAL